MRTWVFISALFLAGCASTGDNGPTGFDRSGQITWRYQSNNKYGVIKVNEQKYFPYHETGSYVYVGNNVNYLPINGGMRSSVKVNDDEWITLYIYKKFLSLHMAKAYLRANVLTMPQ